MGSNNTTTRIVEYMIGMVARLWKEQKSRLKKEKPIIKQGPALERSKL